ncbi:MAG: hypothetical protein M3O74_09900 [Pseudomonadota bacterium]|uniref:Uncharacterized protein n=1 Tax=Caballeronia sordidicola TaxID=196367 RepID=A0A242M6K2_CABSO|nr:MULTISPECIES: hypothetical protein [Burkholderiaceae]MDP9154549.1 hypothetical protein [Pseudomonadota bacterium]OTP66724.1 hypothetical protein PAMC26510_33350 [Caballeronia sordidicola]
MRTLNIRHPAMRCVAKALLDLFPSGADISEIGTDAKPCLFVGWRTSGTAGQPGNIAWGVHYRFEAEALSLFDIACEPAQQRLCEHVRDISRHLKFDYADPDALSLKIVDVTADMVRECMSEA